jgi:ABC-type transporter Mla subunit MlaD
MPQSRGQYEVVESFTDQVGLGKEYAKVRYKGIDEIGYISRVEGPGEEISKECIKRRKDNSLTPI